MKCNPNYLTIDKLRDSSLFLIKKIITDIRKKYKIEYPLNCYKLLMAIQKDKDYNLLITKIDNFNNNLDGCLFYICSKDTYILNFNIKKRYNFNNSSDRRINFTLAHELGHLFLNHCKIYSDDKTEEQIKYEELEANEFAGQLLMPEKEILAINKNTHEDIAKHFNVSKSAVYIRLNNLKRLDKLSEPISFTCKICGNKNISPVANFCNVCGNILDSDNPGENIIDYYKSYKNKRIDSCPICNNNIFSADANFCKICGIKLDNYCHNCYNNCENNHCFCEECGKETSFKRHNILFDWKKEKKLILEG